MRIMYGLIQREIQEHKAGFIWLPLGALCFYIILAIGFMNSGQLDFSMHTESSSQHQNIEFLENLDDGLSASSLLNFSLNHLEQTPDGQEHAFAMFRAVVGYSFHVLFFLIATFYLASTLFDERFDRSILFFKSMPTSDWQTVLSKFLTIWLAVPVFYILAIIATQFSILIIVTISGLVNDAPISILWLNSGLAGGAAHLILGYLVQGLWMLPIYGWLLLVSSSSKRNPVLIAALAPALPILAEGAFFNSTHLLNWAAAHLRMIALPNADSESGVFATLAILGRIDLYLGILVGAIMIAAAIEFRRRKNEI